VARYRIALRGRRRADAAGTRPLACIRPQQARGSSPRRTRSSRPGRRPVTPWPSRRRRGRRPPCKSSPSRAARRARSRQKALTVPRSAGACSGPTLGCSDTSAANPRFFGSHSDRTFSWAVPRPCSAHRRGIAAGHRGRPGRQAGRHPGELTPLPPRVPGLVRQRLGRTRPQGSAKACTRSPSGLRHRSGGPGETVDGSRPVLAMAAPSRVATARPLLTFR
jgi:hypothetical protein